jgi:hypothetical protein
MNKRIIESSLKKKMDNLSKKQQERVLKCALKQTKKGLEKLFWNSFKDDANFSEFEKRTKFILSEWGTGVRCNRFDVGNSIEFLFADFLRMYIPGGLIEETPNERRIDLIVYNLGISIKYSKSNNIKVHNSLGKNKDLDMVTTILITPLKIYLISDNILDEYNINIKDYLVDTGDGLELKRSLLTRLNKIKNFEYSTPINIVTTECKNMLTARLFYEAAMHKYDLSLRNQK